jgi:ABC-type multidrug transport system fused ATPase/permease subunit
VSAIPLIFTSGWASGIDAYAVVLLLGLFGRYGHMASVPPTLERTDVLIVAGALFALQFVVDKIHYLDSTSDLVHTFIRPVIGGAIGALMAGHAHTMPQAVAAAIGGGTALMTHLIKTGVRIGVNHSPEPFSNIAVSLTEHVTVAGIVIFALLHPLAAALIAGVLLLIGMTLLIFLASRIRRSWRRRREHRAQRRAVGGIRSVP